MLNVNVFIDILIVTFTMNKSRTILCETVLSLNASAENIAINDTSLRDYNDSYALHASIYINYSSRDLSSKLSRRDVNSATPAVRSQINESVHFKTRSVCNSNNDCKQYSTLCDTSIKLCHCERGYIPKTISTNINYGDNGNSGKQQLPESRYCVKPAAIGDYCITDEQCYVSNTVCIGSERIGKRICQCKEHYFAEDGFEKVTIEGVSQESRLVCRYSHQGIGSTYIGLLIFFALLTVVAVIVCVIAIIKIKSNKRLTGSERLPGSDQYNNDTATTSTPANNNATVSRDLSNLPPIGSAEAEFQNDFIPVFPMRQLEPCPEKNTTALNMQFNAQG